jgi:hypothetical protein
MSKYTRIQDEDLEKLRVLSKYQRRTMTMQLKHYIEPDYDALMRHANSPTGFDSKPKDLDKITEPYVELMSTPEQKQDMEARTAKKWAAIQGMKPQASFTDKPKPHPKGKSK